MKKIFALVMAAVILTTTAMAADFIPGQKIRFNGNEDRWEGELKSIQRQVGAGQGPGVLCDHRQRRRGAGAVPEA